MNDKIEEVKHTVETMFVRNTRSWKDYERAKNLIQVGFTPGEYSCLIKFIADYLGV
jgi:hypothetical protein